MKKSLFEFMLVLFLFSPSAYAMTSDNIEYNGYFRSGIGTNSLGGNHECFNNKGANTGSTGNEFRLGNECVIYGEAAFVVHHLREKENDAFFKSQIRLAYVSQGFKAYEGLRTSEGSKELSKESDAFHLAEAYVQGGHFKDAPFSFWVGKRFYREPDLYMNDWYYYGNTVGNGAGIEDIPLGIGRLALAQLREVNTKGVILGATNDPSDIDDPIRTEVGRPGITLWDARLKDIVISDNNKLELWLGYGLSPGGTGTVNNVSYEKSTGLVFGAKNHFTFSGGFYDLALLKGSGLMESLELSGDSLPIKGTSTQNDADRWRLVNHINYEIPDSRWAFHAGLTHERWNTGESSKGLGQWTSLGILPVYFLTEHIQITGQIGASLVDIEKEVDSNSNPLGQRTLYRATIAPQLAIKSKLAARPVLRAYYTQSWWNKENKTSMGESAPAYIDKTSGAAYGFQAEVWF